MRWVRPITQMPRSRHSVNRRFFLELASSKRTHGETQYCVAAIDRLGPTTIQNMYVYASVLVNMYFILNLLYIYIFTYVMCCCCWVCFSSIAFSFFLCYHTFCMHIPLLCLSRRFTLHCYNFGLFSYLSLFIYMTVSLLLN